jgi:hypothetical protein
MLDLQHDLYYLIYFATVLGALAAYVTTSRQSHGATARSLRDHVSRQSHGATARSLDDSVLAWAFWLALSSMECSRPD